MEDIGAGSMTTRTLSDINIIQQSLVMAIQMILPVPAVCILGVYMAFRIDRAMGWLLTAVTALIICMAYFVIKRAAPLFERLQKFLDRMNVVIRENITGVRVVRAFNKEKYEEKRMRGVFGSYRDVSVKVNRLFAGLESTALMVINLVIVAILFIGGNNRNGIYGDRRYYSLKRVCHSYSVLSYYGADGYDNASQIPCMR